MLAHKNDISIWKQKEDIDYGWMGKPKGMLQILWERGFIDPSIEDPEKHYTLDGKDGDGAVDESRSLKYLIRHCYDFDHEQTMMQYIGEKLGVIVDRTPKCHCEMAGEGIEYSWGLGKNRYRGLHIRERGERISSEQMCHCVLDENT
jgi:hypothetical protein